MSDGRWVFVCGPSGAGKDSVIAWAQHRLGPGSGVVFARRMVTRAAGPEAQHDAVSPAALQRLQRDGRLAWHWSAHGHGYAIAAHYAQDVDAGRVVVVNGSREHVGSLAPSPRIALVLVTAGADVLRARLHARGRETPGEVAARLERGVGSGVPSPALVLCNEGDLAVAGGQLAAYLGALAAA